MIRLLAVAVVLSVAQTAGATTYKVAPGSEVSFLAHITGSSFTAKNTAVSGSLVTDEANTVTHGVVVLNAAAFDSGLGNRDSHMREKYLETDKCPLITLDLTGAKLPTSPGEADVDGTMEVHCVKKPVKAHVKVAEAGGVHTATSSFPVDITDYGIPQPKFAVVKMDTKVEVTINLRFAKQ